jgi:predicted enzyme related to lactoylglutathione lyase
VPSTIHQVTFDCSDTYLLATFWAEVLGGSLHPDDQPGDPEALVLAPDGSRILLFQQVPEGKAVKNRLHLDLQPRGIRRDDEVQRLLGLGATVVGDRRRPDGTGWVTMADPEGNEFCVERSDLERSAIDDQG